jgi:hypothetical protein
MIRNQSKYINNGGKNTKFCTTIYKPLNWKMYYTLPVQIVSLWSWHINQSIPVSQSFLQTQIQTQTQQRLFLLPIYDSCTGKGFELLPMDTYNDLPAAAGH